ncbi:DM13 domain-containing protein [cf. Phormidesmis sp. LEGE 11477]|uniref:DM13 domain-containing protein n=1 Tax=cf. Phormidesmis sp. LEGE 11477 TaxID=1828680 RepID=UPI0018807D77|nr:DM13 domain-containing protein [cf. Phormidesmis sp. LEGE 11477]MBE9061587.1 DM13 domain-containing protein [cf. Phormidesmis sp. LEGE 11477]
MQFTSFRQQLQRIGFATLVTTVVYQPALQAQGQQIPQPSPTAPVISTLVAANPSADAFSLKANQIDSQIDSLATIQEKASPLAKSVDAAPFIGTDHPTSGAAKVVEVDGTSYLKFDSAFSSDNGPDLFVLLHTEAVPESYSAENYVNLGRLQSVEGAQRYAIPEGVDASAFKSAVIWCRQFNVTFGYATL